MRLVISFCNQPPHTTESNLVVLDTTNGQQSWIPSLIRNRGFTGITQDDEHIYAANQPEDDRQEKPAITVIRKDTMEPIWVARLPEASDVHSIFLDGRNNLYVASTGTEQIILYHVDTKSRKITFVKSIWQPYSYKDKAGVIITTTGRLLAHKRPKIRTLMRMILDRSICSPVACRNTTSSHHINSIAIHKGDIYISAFGPQKGKLKSTATNGYVYNITKGTKILNGIYHPHSLIVSDHGVFYCESARRKIKNHQTDVIILNSGYTRGLCVENGHIIVGSSTGRRKSRSTHIVNNIADPGLLEPVCKVSIFQHSKETETYELVKEYDFLPHRTEIYDIMVLR